MNVLRRSVLIRYALVVSAFLALAARSLNSAEVTSFTLAEAIDQVLSSRTAHRSFWGVHIVELNSGRVLYERNSEKLFVPASNQKLLSTALALSLLGPDHRYTTSLVSEAEIGNDGVLQGDLVLLGGGDPNLSARILPYNSTRSFQQDLLLPISELAEQAVQSGLKRIEGSIVGDDTRYVQQPHGSGWAIDDPKWGYGAPISALSFNDNVVTMRVLPGRAAGQPARVEFKPDVPYFSFSNRTRTMATRTVAQRLDLDNQSGTGNLLLWGQISVRSRGRSIEVAVDNPALFAAVALRERLAELGVEIAGETRARHRLPLDVPDLKGGSPKEEDATTAIAMIQSGSLAEDLPVVNKVSQNLHAEMLLREVGYARRDVGSFEAGLEEMKSFLREAGINKWQYRLRDASGLSRQNLISPAATVQLLTHMAKSKYGDLYRASLAVAGEDGTLDWRFSRSPVRGRISAKTGTLTGVSALSGYAQTQDGRDLVFSIYVNNSAAPNSYVRRLIDRIAEAMVTAPPVAPSPTPAGTANSTSSGRTKPPA
jgi:D-alanyl-D-alanine carboxypeptidase/D-alanyl-D-alanine-endopeptidase (penicillin-binding protein 4)